VHCRPKPARTRVSKWGAARRHIHSYNIPTLTIKTARLFNDPDSGYDILIASDAIGMGLNLNIRRVIFHTIYKSDGKKIIRLGHSSLKQIAGRAGRRNSEFKFGEVTSRLEVDLPYIRSQMSKEVS